MQDTKVIDIINFNKKEMRETNTRDILIDIKDKMKDNNDILILIDSLLVSLKDSREVFEKNTKVKIFLIFHYAANNAAEKAGGNSAEKAAIYSKTFADLYRTQYFDIIESYKEAAEKSKNL